MTNQFTSRALALAFAGANLLICAAVVTVFVVTKPESKSAARFPVAPSTTDEQTTTTVRSYPPTTTEESPPPKSSEPAIGPDIQEVTGSGEMTTAIPNGWPLTRAPGPGSTQATDPDDPARFLRFGGSPAPDEDSLDSHVAYERDFQKTHNGFESIRLERTTLHGAPAVDWEFEWDATEGRRHVHSVYWRAQGYEYFVYASSPVEKWSSTESILDVMINHAAP